MSFAKRLWEEKRERLEALLFDGGIGEVEFTEEALALNYDLDEIEELLAQARDLDEANGQFGVGA